jgi:hypothetical protein
VLEPSRTATYVKYPYQEYPHRQSDWPHRVIRTLGLSVPVSSYSSVTVFFRSLPVYLETDVSVVVPHNLLKTTFDLLVFIQLGNNITPRSKYYAIKTVWFREGIIARGIKVVAIETRLQ